MKPWVATHHDRAEADGLTGVIQTFYKNGVPQRVEREEVFFPPPEPVPAKSMLPHPVCPNGCGPMSEHDYGNVYKCHCGAKRTRAQVLAAAKSAS